MRKIAFSIGVYCFLAVYLSAAASGMKFVLNSTGTGYRLVKSDKSAIAVIPLSHLGKPVLEIGENAFTYNYRVKKIIIGNNVSRIRRAAFELCSATNITIGKKVKRIDEFAFSTCKKLRNIIIPDNVTTIGNKAFYNCSGLKTVSIGKRVARIGNNIFSGCSRLRKITVSPESKFYKTADGVLFTKNGKALLAYPGKKTGNAYSIPRTVTCIKNSAFAGCGRLAGIIIPKCVEVIERSAFRECGKLTKITIPDRVTRIGRWAFQYCYALRSITIGKSVKRIGKDPFSNCSSLQTFLVHPQNRYFKSRDGVLYSGKGDTLIAYPSGKSSRSFSIPESVTRIGESAFAGAKNLTSITLGRGVEHIGGFAFFRCSALKKIRVPKKSRALYKGMLPSELHHTISVY